jgi:uracil-DNA glycosylase
MGAGSACYDARAMGAHPGKAAILPEREASAAYDPDCRRCPRLVSFLDAVRTQHRGYFCRPVPPFGAPDARLVIVGLAPGMHGAYGFASQAAATSQDDGLELIDCRITNAVKCLPPSNKPVPAEVRACNGFLAGDLAGLPRGGAILALGRIAHDATLLALNRRLATHAFAHGAAHPLEDGSALFDSYHCSRYNTNTRRLTPAMFRAVFDDIVRHLDGVGRVAA